MTAEHHAALLRLVGERVRAARKGRGWSRRVLAERTDISERFLADIETGRANPSLLKLCELADALELRLPTLLADGRLVPRSGPLVVSLLGLRGAGKSTVGRGLAAELGADFRELDAVVEETVGLPLRSIFEFQGEATYRRAEREALRALLGQLDGPLVLATGGGIVGEADTYTLLRERTHTVWLRAEPRDHWSRVIDQGDTRPMADNEQAFSELCSILSEREPLYAEAEVIVDTSGRTPAEVVADLATRFQPLLAAG